MATRITLDTHFEAFVQGQLSTGRYAEAGDVVQDALRLLEERERRLAVLDAAVERSYADIKAGNTVPIDEVADRLRAKYTAMAQERGEL
jgi:antitoxin ParD1/3/4